jgi:hypothetical protein
LEPCWVEGYGVGITVKLMPLVAVPPAVVIDITPEAVPGITKPTNCEPVLEIAIAETPPIVNAVGLPRLVPVMVTKVPTDPMAGVKDVIVGGRA